ncbi:MAG: flagellar basal body P-ring protein FlgI [Mariprofundaceae bacterium]
MAILMRLFIPILLMITFSHVVMAERIKDIATVEGVRSNALIGYGLVVGLNSTGDSSGNSPATIISYTAMLQRFGINTIPQISTVKPKNVASVIVTAELPPFAKPGQKIDVTISSASDAKSLRGGTLLITPLVGGDGQAYAVAQGSLSIGGFTAAGAGARQSKGHPTTGRIPNGASVERASPKGLERNQNIITLSLNRPDFTTVKRMQDVINQKLGGGIAQAIDAGTIEVQNKHGNSVLLMAEIEQLQLKSDHSNTVIMDERTGTIVMGQDVQIDTVAVAHGAISVTVREIPLVSQPGAFAGGETAVVDRTDLEVTEDPSKLVVLSGTVSLSELVNALNAVGATPSDLIAVLQAIKAAGALHADLRML